MFEFWRENYMSEAIIVGISACTPSENPEVSFCLGRHPSQLTEYWLYYETWGIFHNVLHFYRINDFIEITKRGLFTEKTCLTSPQIAFPYKKKKKKRTIFCNRTVCPPATSAFVF